MASWVRIAVMARGSASTTEPLAGAADAIAGHAANDAANRAAGHAVGAITRRTPPRSLAS
jgi:hypothetical protein